jgi:hypothetical protein
MEKETPGRTISTLFRAIGGFLKGGIDGIGKTVFNILMGAIWGLFSAHYFGVTIWFFVVMTFVWLAAWVLHGFWSINREIDRIVSADYDERRRTINE